MSCTWSSLLQQGYGVQVTLLYTAPTAIRALQSFGDDFVAKHARATLRILGTVGEPINPEAWKWYHEVRASPAMHRPRSFPQEHVDSSMPPWRSPASYRCSRVCTRAPRSRQCFCAWQSAWMVRWTCDCRDALRSRATCTDENCMRHTCHACTRPTCRQLTCLVTCSGSS